MRAGGLETSIQMRFGKSQSSCLVETAHPGLGVLLATARPSVNSSRRNQES